MTYKRNGKAVTKEEFMEGAVGWDFSKPGSFHVGSFKPFQSPVDGKMINNSVDLSNHNRRHKVEQVGHEYEKTVINNKLEKEHARESR